MAEKYKLLQRSNVSEQYPFSWKVFSGWDHAITHAETAKLKAIHLANSLRVRGGSFVHESTCTQHLRVQQKASTLPSATHPHPHIHRNMPTHMHSTHTVLLLYNLSNHMQETISETEKMEGGIK